ncbi:MAG TPA: nuclear transport factor 2 family protein [Steroidobacteraceae bacterium]|nr:nuclear transport factor 2 family protein [Steroidobacteraceae bacterium]
MSVLILALGVLGTSVPLPARAAACDRSCLKSVLDRYLTAVTRHDPSAAPLAPSYRHTENAINIPLGKGVWQSVTGLGQVQRRYLDPVSGQAAYYGIVAEGSQLAIVTARLRIENRSITEAEWYIAREADPGLPGAKPPSSWNPQSLSATPPPERVLPPSRRLPRETMIAIVNSYFDGITSHDGTVVHAQAGCNRYENGTRVTGRRGGVNDDCVSGLTNFNLANVAARRVAFVDDEAGVVLGMAVFIRRAGSNVPRNAFSEWFWIEDGKIRNIWTAMYYPGPERPVPNWPPFDGNFPLPVFTTGAPVPATASASYAADLAAISAFNVKYLKAINDGDISALSALTDDDHIALPPGAAPLMGKAANVAVNGRIYQQSRVDEHWTPLETVIDGNLAYQRGTFTAVATPKAAGGTVRSISGSFLRIYRRQPDGSWVMTRDMFNSGPPDSPAH